MSEPSKDRDKAVDEALRGTTGCVEVTCPCGARQQQRPHLNLLWQRAQEAEREECALVIERAEVGQFPRVILAEMIRNRSAARAPREPKP